MSKKEQAFEYLVPQIAKWWVEQNPSKKFEDNDLSTLKILKLLFFISAVKSNRENDGLLNIFDRWVAMPYGHIERDVYQMIKGKKGIFKNFVISNGPLVLK